MSCNLGNILGHLPGIRWWPALSTWDIYWRMWLSRRALCGMVREPLPSAHSDHPRQVLSVLIVILSTGIFMNAAIGGSLETPSVALNYSGSSAMK